jgi:hypothetical protein
MRKTRRSDTRYVADATEQGQQIDETALPIAAEFLRPVGINFLAQILGKQSSQIAKQMSKCPIIGYHKASGREHPLFDFKTAMSYLVPPRGNIEDFFASKNAATLPPYVNKMFWDSAHQRNRVMLASNDLWHTEDVITALGRTALTIKEETTLWVENLPERDLLSDKQYDSLVKAVIRLQDSIRERMIEMPDHFRTFAMSDTIETELEESGTMPGEAPE